ncbi:hypothetical protein [Flavobacterium sp.]|uniref:hypothetical protein n=1 Tax=Flavobacterium sp. TaxID=239 RepID=UPI0026202DCB|nr:hypothetical protein [Flavobacterium sp.]
MNSYKENFKGELIKISTNEIVPKIMGNTLFEEYLIYLNQGGTVDYDNTIFEVFEVPEQVTAIQFIAQLSFEGITEASILEVIDTLPEPNKTIARASFLRAVYFERNNPFIPLVGMAFNKTSEQLDQIFINASKL